MVGQAVGGDLVPQKASAFVTGRASSAALFCVAAGLGALCCASQQPQQWQQGGHCIIQGQQPPRATPAAAARRAHPPGRAAGPGPG